MPPSRNGSDIDVKTFRSPGGRDVVKWNGITFSEMGASPPLEKEAKRGRVEGKERGKLMMQGPKRLRHKNTHGSPGYES